MSELIDIRDNRATIRRKLLITASVLALVASSASVSRAEDADRPTLWIELGGQMETMQGISSPFVEPFMLITPTPDPYKHDSLIATQRPPRIAFGAEGKISFQPQDSDWIFSAGIRYGRSHKHQHVHHQTSVPPVSVTFYGYSYTFPQALEKLADTKAQYSENHAIADFTVGKDVGLGLLGREGKSSINAGVRFAQFSIKSAIDITARPSVGITYPIPGFPYPFPSYSEFAMQAKAARSFKGIGPSLSWNGSAAILGDEEDGEVTLDLGINAAMLFGKQKAKVDHSTQAHHFSFYHVYKYHTKPDLYPPRSNHSTRSHSVAVPNVGGFAGISVKYPNVKVSLGYRADVFFGATDTGIDDREKSNLAFHGPYASISIGIGN